MSYTAYRQLAGYISFYECSELSVFPGTLKFPVVTLIIQDSVAVQHHFFPVFSYIQQGLPAVFSRPAIVIIILTSTI
jgi:PII-like signaling protein